MTRACSRSSLPRPYIWRLTSLSLVIKIGDAEHIWLSSFRNRGFSENIATARDPSTELRCQHNRNRLPNRRHASTNRPFVAPRRPPCHLEAARTAGLGGKRTRRKGNAPAPTGGRG